MKGAGELRHRVTLENPGTAIPDNEGGFTQTWTRLGGTDHAAAVEPATARDLERTVSNTVQSTASHIVTIRYLPDVTTQTRLIFHDEGRDRTFSITGVQDPGERHRELVLACEEQV